MELRCGCLILRALSLWSSTDYRLGVGATPSGNTGLTGPTDANVVNVQFLSTTIFGNPVVVYPGDKWSYSLTYQPGGGPNFGTNQVTYSISRTGSTQTFTAQVDIATAIATAPSLGGGLAWLGFVGASGGATEEIWVTNVQVR